MADSITIKATSIPDGTQSTITLSKTGDDSGTISLDGQSFDLNNITASADGLKLQCDGPLGTNITGTVQPGNPAFITVEIKGFLIHSTKHYQVASADQQKLTQFIKDANFPPLT